MNVTIDLNVVTALSAVIVNGIVVGSVFIKLERRLTRLEANVAILLRISRLGSTLEPDDGEG